MTADRKGDTVAEGGSALVELLVVLAIFSLVAATGLAEWQHWRLARGLPDIVDRLDQLAQTARTQARRSGRPVSVEIDIAERLMRVPALGRSVTLPSGVTFIARTASLAMPSAIVFLADGSSTGGQVSISDEAGKRVTLSVSWLGTVRHE
jgi:general secretion pathway protein H